ncbi:MAG: DNA polymerase III subunit gamma/tau, partial [Glaciimonas sp.]|nr:DNA polymerase III subunit gamma/tau [Glaciimonas sp.]
PQAVAAVKPPVTQGATPAALSASASAPTIAAPAVARLSSQPSSATTSVVPTAASTKLSPAMAALAAARGTADKNQASRMSATPPAASIAMKVEQVQASYVKPIPTPLRSEHDNAAAPPWEEIPLPTDIPNASFSSAEAEQRSIGDLPAAAVATPIKSVEQKPMQQVAQQPVKTVVEVSAEVNIEPLKLHPDASLNWDGNWPVLAGQLSVRGVAHQLAQQSELLRCDSSGAAVQMHLRIPLDTLRSAGSVEKLEVALSEYFDKTVRVETELGTVRHTANAKFLAEMDQTFD